ncbi:glutamate receptor ionotropic, kainate 2-like isoform X1 [Tetranychus urticae]|uniref:glutamate receptor ionotropic, kainate 2-like isoform X1 n=1 Tax=Tetranychus urticae TaxID=32264 RepID=UPI00077BEDC8|nr:glutamate receptor ionotropic, kainate 2-like isoform X1 [Tetranychus urticae]
MESAKIVYNVAIIFLFLSSWNYFSNSAQSIPTTVKIGALFTKEEKDSQTELAFKYAVYRVNKDPNILPNTTLVYDIQYVPHDDSFHASKKACFQVTSGVISIFGPQDPLLGIHVQSLCDALDIPHMEARLQNLGEAGHSKEFSINLHPGSAAMSDSLRDLIIYLNWTKVAVLYEDDMSLIGLQELIKPPLPKNVQFVFRKTEPQIFRETLLDIKNRNIYSLIVDTKPESLPYLLTAILQVQMNDYKYHYHFTTFDVEIYDLENFKYNFVNMTAYRLIDSSNTRIGTILEEIEKIQAVGQPILNRTKVIQAAPALMYDSVYALAMGLHSLQLSNPSIQLRTSNASCETENPWIDGSSLFNYINSVEYRGLTGRIKFTEGVRASVKMDLLKLRQHDLDKVGEWTNTGGLNITNAEAFHEFGTTNITLRVTTIEEIPYLMRKKDSNLTGNDRYEGFCIDLLQSIAEALDFHYELHLVPDGKFGAQDTTTKEWNGLVRELMDKKADLAVAPMTITYTRESVIDFTKPFMNLGIGILFKIPSNMPTRLFSFMSPLAVDIWLYVLAAYILVSSTLFIVARFSPYEWTNPHPCARDSDVIENQFSLADSFWFTVVTLMKQGCDLNPRAVSTRIIGAIWWFFTLILISSYTANLAAFLTVERMVTPIESVEDLASQQKIAYGTLEGGSTMTFFRDSKIPTYQKMWRYMENNPHVFVKSYSEGVERVLQGNYAFLMESTMLDYKVQRDCNLTQVGGLLDSKGYGIATPMGSPWRDRISLAILDLQEKGIIQMLYDKWWKSPGLTCIRDEMKNKDGKASALGLDNIGGVFVVLLFGLALALITAVGEFFWNSRKNTKATRQSFCSEMAEELRFAVKCRASRQRPVLKRQCSNCFVAPTYVPNGSEQPIHENGILHGLYDLNKSTSLEYHET